MLFAETVERGSGAPRMDRISTFPPMPITIPATNSSPTILAVVLYVFTFSAMDRPCQPGGRVASPDLEGEQEAILQPYAATAKPRNERSLLVSEACVCAPAQYVLHSTKQHPNVREPSF